MVMAGCRTVDGDTVFLRCSEYEIESSISSRISDVSYVILEQDSLHILARVNKLVIEDNGIYIGDYRTRKIFAYDTLGTLKGVLDRYGRGPGEYLEIREFAVDANHIYVLDNYLNKLLVYSREDMTFLYDLKVPFQFWDFEILSDGGFLFAYAPMQGAASADSGYRLIVTDSALNVRNRMLEYETGTYDALGFRNNLTSYGGRILYSSYEKDGYCLLDRKDGALLESVEIEFDKGIPKGCRSDLETVLEGKYTYLYEAPVMCQDLLLFQFAVDGSGRDYLLDSDIGEFMVNSIEDIRRMFGVVSSYDDYFIAYWGDSQVYESVTSRGFPEAAGDAEKAILNDCPYLVFYHVE